MRGSKLKLNENLHVDVALQLTCGSILALLSEHHAYVGQTTAAQFTGPVRRGEGPEAVTHGQ